MTVSEKLVQLKFQIACFDATDLVGKLGPVAFEQFFTHLFSCETRYLPLTVPFNVAADLRDDRKGPGTVGGSGTPNWPPKGPGGWLLFTAYLKFHSDCG